jgi:hypothetical protein
MHPLSASELLSAWEWGQERSLPERALGLLAASYPQESADHLLALSIGRRDARLLALRERVFGARLDLQVACPQCANRLELDLHTTDLLAAVPEAPQAREDMIEHAGWRVRYRLLNSGDMVDAAAARNPAEARAELLRRCVLAVEAPRSTAGSVQGADLPADIQALVIAELQRLDPASSFTFDMACPTCAHRWGAPFDILSFFWTEIEAWAFHTLHEVHLLALAYGWSETDILALGRQRRQTYLQLVGHG